jgi:hypothetical protein
MAALSKVAPPGLVQNQAHRPFSACSASYTPAGVCLCHIGIISDSW